MAHLADGFLTLSPATVEPVRHEFRRLRNKPAGFAWHPVYTRSTDLPDRIYCRQEVGVSREETLFVFLGMIRPYKGIRELIERFCKAADCQSRLLVAGHCENPSEIAMLSRMATGDPRVILSIGGLDDDSYARLLVASDAVVLPYREYLHSGSIIHALSYARPVITSSTLFSDALSSAVGAEWVQTYSGELPEETFNAFRAATGTPDLALLAPERIGSAAKALYLHITGRAESADRLAALR